MVKGDNLYAEHFQATAATLGIEPTVVKVETADAIEPVIADLGAPG